MFRSVHVVAALIELVRFRLIDHIRLKMHWAEPSKTISDLKTVTLSVHVEGHWMYS